MKTLSYSAIVAIASLFIGLPDWGYAAPIAVPNSDFELPVTGNYTGSITDWTLNNPDSLPSANYGVQHETGSILSDHVAAGGTEGDGAQWAYLQWNGASPGGGIGVNVTTTNSLGTVAAGTYTLTFDIGRRSCCDGDIGSSVAADLLSNGVSFGAATVDVSSASAGKMDADVSLVAAVNSGDAAMGGDLKIRISHVHNGASPATGFYQAQFDKVGLDFEPIPEPAGFLLCAFGFAALGAGALRRRPRR